MLDTYIDNLDSSTAVSLAVRVTHKREDKGRLGVGWYAKCVSLQQDNSGVGARRYNSFLDPQPTAHSEDLVLQVTKVGLCGVGGASAGRVDGEEMRLLAWTRLRALQRRKRTDDCGSQRAGEGTAAAGYVEL